MSARMAVAVAALTVLVSCATTTHDRVTSIKEARIVAWSLDAAQDEMIVSVSPARQSLQLAGTTGLVVGSGISAVVNDKYRRIVREALTGYDPGKVFETELASRLDQAMGQELVSVAPLGTTAGYQNKREAQQARLEGIAANTGADLLLDLDMTYGIFGYEGILVAKLDGRLLTLPKGRELWDQTIVVSAEPILASNRLRDPTKQFGPDLGGLRLTVEEGAVEQWTADQGAELKRRFEQAVDGVVSALLAALDLEHEAVGEYHLGRNAMSRKKFEKADEHFRRALAHDPAYVPALNGRAVTLYHNDQLDAAIALAAQIVADYPDYGPAWLNLAWFYAEGKKDGAAANPAYQRALELGMPADETIEKALAGG